MTESILVLCPTRNRVRNAWDTMYSLDQTRSLDSTRVLFIVDDDDENLEEYQAEQDGKALPLRVVPAGLGMNGALNRVAVEMTEEASVIGFIGDDHRFRTKGWDHQFLGHAASHKASMMYGFDGARNDIPTQVFLSSNIVRILGFMAPPPLHHLYMDDYWAQLGAATGVLRFFPEVLIEHMHAFYGKAEWDEGYKRVNDQSVYNHDREALARWRHEGRFDEDVTKVLSLL